MIDYRVDTLNSHNQWDLLFRKISPEKWSPFSRHEFYSAYMFVESNSVECFMAYQDDDNFLLYPYQKKNIRNLGYHLFDEFFDISGAYGYNGPVGKAEDSNFICEYNKELQAHLVNSKVVTELVRYCPLIDSRTFHSYTDKFHVLDNVYIDLAQGLDYVWNQSFEYRVRKSVRKGQSYGLKTTIVPGTEIAANHLDVFYRIYTNTMDRNKADGFYYFDLDFFSQIIEHMGEMSLLAITYLKATPITAELLLVGGELAYGFLGGTLGEYYQYKANTFQRWELIKHLHDMGVKKYSMGGGATRGDSIYDFKMSFAKGCNNPFYIGTKVHLPDVYDEIRSQWAERYPLAAEKNSHKLQGYRILS